MEGKKGLKRLAYLDSVLFIDGKYIDTLNDSVRYSFNMGGIHQVLTDKFGYDNIYNSMVAHSWLKKNRRQP